MITKGMHAVKIRLKDTDCASVELKQIMPPPHQEESIKLGDGPIPTVNVFNYNVYVEYVCG